MADTLREVRSVRPHLETLDRFIAEVQGLNLGDSSGSGDRRGATAGGAARGGCPGSEPVSASWTDARASEVVGRPEDDLAAWEPLLKLASFPSL